MVVLAKGGSVAATEAEDELEPENAVADSMREVPNNGLEAVPPEALEMAPVAAAVDVPFWLALKPVEAALPPGVVGVYELAVDTLAEVSETLELTLRDPVALGARVMETLAPPLEPSEAAGNTEGVDETVPDSTVTVSVVTDPGKVTVPRAVGTKTVVPFSQGGLRARG